MASAFSTSNTLVLRSFNKDIALPGDPITVTVTLTNLEEAALRGCYYGDHIPEGLEVTTGTVKIDGREVTNGLLETAGAGDVYSTCITRRWVLETPTSFTQNNPVNTSATLEIVYTLTAARPGTFDLDEFHWVGYYEGGMPTFGHSEAGDEKTLTFNGSSTVDAHSSPQADLELADWNDTEAEKMSVLKFRVTDNGGDGLATLIDRVVIDVGGTAGHAANDIAWAELRDETTTRVALASSITDSAIVFGAAPNADGTAQLDSVADSSRVAYTVNVYLNTSLQGGHDETYVFDVDETKVGVDGGSGSPMAGATGAVTPVTGRLFITQLGVAVSPDTGWLIGPTQTNAVVESGPFAAANSGNVPEDLAIAGDDGSGGWRLDNSAGLNAFKVEVDNGDDGSYETVLTTATQTFAPGVAAGSTETLGLRYSAPSQDTVGGGVAQDFTITLKASRHAP
jgi:uncharacterized repeat protein (TIGR01451 family)